MTDPPAAPKAAASIPRKDPPVSGFSRMGTSATSKKRQGPFHLDRLPLLWEQTEEPLPRKQYLLLCSDLPGVDAPPGKLRGDEFWFSKRVTSLPRGYDHVAPPVDSSRI